jgi:hypothetical protein
LQNSFVGDILRFEEVRSRIFPDTSSNPLQQSPELCTLSFPRLSQYCPRQFLAMFYDRTELFFQAEGIANLCKEELEDFESSLGQLFSDQRWVPFVLKLSPHVFSIALKVLLEGFAKAARVSSALIIVLVIEFSRYLAEGFVEHLAADPRTQYMTWLDLRNALYAWVEEAQDAQEILRAAAALVETIPDDWAEDQQDDSSVASTTE